MSQKKWTSSGGFIKNEEGDIIACVLDNCSPQEENLLTVAPIAISAIRDFVDAVNSGTHKPRAAVKEFELILSLIDI